MKRYFFLIAILVSLSLLFGCTARNDISYTVETVPPTESNSDEESPETEPPTESNSDEESPETEPSLGLLPSEDYGMLYPFIGMVDENGIKYGLNNADGEIVVEPIYYAVEPVENSYTGRVDSFSMWELYIAPPYMAADGLNVFLLASYDGTSVSTQSYHIAQRYEDYVFATYYDDNMNSYIHVYDATGKLCLDTADWGLEGVYVMDYGCGVFNIALCDYRYWADWNGNLLAGPFDYYVEAFTDGYGCVTFDRNTYAYLDAEGNRLLDRDFYSAESFENGYAAVSLSLNEQALLSVTDGIVFTCEGDYSDVEGALFHVRQNNRDIYYNLSGEKLFESEEFEDYDIINDKLIYDDQSGILINLESGEEFLGEKCTYYNWHDSPASVSYYTVETVGEDWECVSGGVMDENFNLLLQTDGEFDYEFDAKAQIGYFRNKNTLHSIQRPYEFVGTFDRIFDGRIFSYDEIGSYQYDLNGNLLFSYTFK